AAVVPPTMPREQAHPAVQDECRERGCRGDDRHREREGGPGADGDQFDDGAGIHRSRLPHPVPPPQSTARLGRATETADSTRKRQPDGSEVPSRCGGARATHAGRRMGPPVGCGGRHPPLPRKEQSPVSTPSTHVVDTVENAAATPEREQPYAALGLTTQEYRQIREIRGRRPTSGELAMYSVRWSEHCSYKSSKVHLRQFGQKVTPEMTKNLMVGMGENAGVVDIGEGWAVTFKIESHNHPSYVEPFQGAATGVGGIVRDIISMGARPVAVMDALRFGALDHPDTARVVPGVVSGISFYGNCLGLPNIGGETWFDPVYQANPLVNALAVGVLRHEDLHLANARGIGNKVVLFGARTGGDGIGGASILASESFDEGSGRKRPAVQVGDPFMEKVLIE